MKRVGLKPDLQRDPSPELSGEARPCVRCPPLHSLARSARAARRLFRVWAPQARAVEVVFEESQEAPLALKREADGYFSGATSARVSLYKYRVDGTGPWPDPCSRFQPQGVHGPR